MGRPGGCGGRDGLVVGRDFGAGLWYRTGEGKGGGKGGGRSGEMGGFVGGFACGGWGSVEGEGWDRRGGWGVERGRVDS